MLIRSRLMVPVYAVLLVMLCAFKAWPSSVTVELPNQQTELYYSAPVRLSTVLLDAQRLELNRFGLANHLALLDSNSDMASEKSEIYSQLQQRVNKPNNVSLNKASQAILEQLKQFTYLRRLAYKPDADWARSQILSDPILAFQDGRATLRFRLIQALRPENIRIMGAVDKPGLVPFKAHWQLSDYLEKHQISLLAGAQKDLAFAIQPDGVVTPLPHGWWNAKEVYFAPGATIFIGLRSLAWENEELNLEIAELLTNKVGL